MLWFWTVIWIKKWHVAKSSVVTAKKAVAIALLTVLNDTKCNKGLHHQKQKNHRIQMEFNLWWSPLGCKLYTARQ